MSQVEAQRALNKQSVKGWSPLLMACYKGHKEVVQTLLENHARVDVFDVEGRSALHLAADNGYQVGFLGRSVRPAYRPASVAWMCPF